MPRRWDVHHGDVETAAALDAWLAQADEVQRDDEETDAWGRARCRTVLGDVTDESENRPASCFRQWTRE